RIGRAIGPVRVRSAVRIVGTARVVVAVGILARVAGDLGVAIETEAVGDRKVHIGLVGQPDDVRRSGTVGGDADLGAGVTLRLSFVRCRIVDRLVGAGGGRQRRSQTRSVGTGIDDLGGVGVVGGGDDQRLTVLLREGESGFDRLVDVVGRTHLPARVPL